MSLIQLKFLPAVIQALVEPPITYAGFSGSITTTSATDVLMTGLTLTPGAGTFQVIGATTMAHSTSGATIFMSVYANGVQVAASESGTTPRFASGGGLGVGVSAIPLPVMVIAEVTVAAAQTIEIRWRTTAATATSTNRSLLINKVR